MLISACNVVPVSPKQAWVGMWTGGLLIVIACMDLSAYICLCTRFLHDIYAVFVCTIYISDGMVGVAEYVCMSACLRACVPACLRACVPACLRACVPACLRACLPAGAHCHNTITPPACQLPFTQLLLTSSRRSALATARFLPSPPPRALTPMVFVQAV